MKKLKLPNFFVVGATKAGTTSLYHYLKQHPEIYMCPIKEPNYFSKDINPNEFSSIYKKTCIVDMKAYLGKPKLEELHIAMVTEFEDYIQLFREVKDEKAIGEISNSYLYSKVAAKEIKKIVPNAKIIMILRNPVERAFSHFIMNLKGGYVEYFDFLKEVFFDYNKTKKGWGISHLYIELGLYYEQVKRFLDTFGKNQVKIFLYEEYKNNPAQVLKEIFKFLEVDSTFVPNLSKKYHLGTPPKYPRLNKVLINLYYEVSPYLPKSLIKLLEVTYKKFFLQKKRATLSPTEQKELLKFFYEDVKKLEKLINKDLSDWLKV